MGRIQPWGLVCVAGLGSWRIGSVTPRSLPVPQGLPHGESVGAEPAELQQSILPPPALPVITLLVSQP